MTEKIIKIEVMEGVTISITQEAITNILTGMLTPMETTAQPPTPPPKKRRKRSHTARRWTKDEDNFITANAGKMPVSKIAKMINRTKPSVYGRMQKLRIRA